MKFIYAIAALLLIGTASAQQHPQQEFIDTLTKRGENLLRDAKLLTDSLRQQGKAHLVDAIDHELVFVEALVLDLKQAAAHVTGQNIHQIHVLEEELLHRENRLAEEFDIILNRVVPTQHANQTAAEVITRGEALVKTTQDELKTLPANSREAKTIENELFHVQRLLEAVKQNPNAATNSAVEQLARHEATLDSLVKRAKAGQTPKTP